MKKSITLVSSLFAVAAAIIVSTSSCKKDPDPKPTTGGNTTPGINTTPGVNTVPAASFGAEKTGTIYARNSNDGSASTIGSFYSLEVGSSQSTCAARSTASGASFQLLDVVGSSTTSYSLTNIASFGSANTCPGINSGDMLTNGAMFASTSTAYASVTAADVDAATISASTIDITSASTILIKNKAGKKGVMSISLSDDAGTTVKKKLTFAFKMLN